MPGVDVDCFKLVVAGTIDTSQDWSTGWFFKVEGLSAAPTTTQMNAALAAVTDDLQYWWTAVKIAAAANTKWTTIRGYWYPAHSAVSTVVAEADSGAPFQGSGSTPHPTQTAIVASLRTGVSGRSARGRSYFPATGIGLDVNGQVSGGDCGTLATHFGNVLADCAFDLASSLASSGVAPVVYSAKTGGTHQIIEVIVDSRCDTQRRRADKVAAENSSTQPVTPH